MLRTYLIAVIICHLILVTIVVAFASQLTVPFGVAYICTGWVIPVVLMRC